MAVHVAHRVLLPEAAEGADSCANNVVLVAETSGDCVRNTSGAAVVRPCAALKIQRPKRGPYESFNVQRRTCRVEDESTTADDVHWANRFCCWERVISRRQPIL